MISMSWVTDAIVEGVDDLDVLDVWGGISSVVETFHVVPETLIMLLPNGL
jgi:hypothetical protein